jgi:hypothetical protein
MKEGLTHFPLFGGFVGFFVLVACASLSNSSLVPLSISLLHGEWFRFFFFFLVSLD